MDCLVICQDAMKIDWDDWKSWMRLVSTQTARKKSNVKRFEERKQLLAQFFQNQVTSVDGKQKWYFITPWRDGWSWCRHWFYCTKCEVGMDAARMERCQWNSAEIVLRGDRSDGLCWPSCRRSSWNKKYVRISNNQPIFTFGGLVLWLTFWHCVMWINLDAKQDLPSISPQDLFCHPEV